MRRVILALAVCLGACGPRLPGGPAHGTGPGTPDRALALVVAPGSAAPERLLAVADLLLPLLNRHWPGRLLERTELDKLLAEQSLSSGLANGDGPRPGRIAAAYYLLQLSRDQGRSSYTLTRCPDGTALSEGDLPEEASDLGAAFHVMAAVIPRLAAPGAEPDPRRIRVSVGAFVDRTPLGRLLAVNPELHRELRSRLLQSETFAVTERGRVSALLDEVRLASEGFAGPLVFRPAALAADLLLTGEYGLPEALSLERGDTPLVFTCRLLSLTGRREARVFRLDGLSSALAPVAERILAELKAYSEAAPAEGPGGSRASDPVRAEAAALRDLALASLPAKPLENGDYYTTGGWCAIPDLALAPEPYIQALRALENAMLLAPEDRQLREWTGVTLAAISGARLFELSTEVACGRADPQAVDLQAERCRYLHALNHGIDYLLLAHLQNPGLNTRGLIRWLITVCARGEAPFGSAWARAQEMRRLVAQSGPAPGWTADYVERMRREFVLGSGDPGILLPTLAAKPVRIPRRSELPNQGLTPCPPGPIPANYAALQRVSLPAGIFMQQVHTLFAVGDRVWLVAGELRRRPMYGRLLNVEKGAVAARFAEEVDSDRVLTAAACGPWVCGATDGDGTYVLDSRAGGERVRYRVADSPVPTDRVSTLCSDGQRFYLLFTAVGDGAEAQLYWLDPARRELGKQECRYPPSVMDAIEWCPHEEGDIWKQRSDHFADTHSACPIRLDLRVWGSRRPHSLLGVTLLDQPPGMLLRAGGLCRIRSAAVWQGRLWVAGEQGLYAADLGTRRFKRYLQDMDEKLLCLCATPDRLFVGTQVGLFAVPQESLAPAESLPDMAPNDW